MSIECAAQTSGADFIRAVLSLRETASSPADFLASSDFRLRRSLNIEFSFVALFDSVEKTAIRRVCHEPA